MSNYVRVLPAAEIPDGERAVLEVDDGLFVAVFNVGGEYYAVEDICTHDDGPLAEGELNGCEIRCPRHGARFDIRTGKALSLPAVVNIETFPIKVEDGYIHIDIGDA